MKNKTKSEEMYENMSKEEKDFILYMSSVNRYGIMNPMEYLFGKKPVYEFEDVDDDNMKKLRGINKWIKKSSYCIHIQNIIRISQKLRQLIL